MSLETQSAVMRAGNNEAALKALALSGNMDAIAALKKLLDAKSSRDAAARQAGLQQPETPPVLEQVVGQLGQQEYAAGGRVRTFAGGGGAYGLTPEELAFYKQRNKEQRDAFFSKFSTTTAPSDTPRPNFNDPKYYSRPMTMGENKYPNRKREAAGAPSTAAEMLLAEPSENSRDLGDLFRKIMFGGKTREQYYKEDPAQAPAPAVAPMAAPNPTTRMQRNGSTVPAPAPAPAAPRANVGIAPNMEQDTVERDSGPRGRLAVPAPAAAPEAKDLTDTELQKRLDELTPLQKEREELRKKSREQLEAAYNAKVKNLTPSTYDRFMDFMAGVSAKGGSSAAQALGAGALNMHAKDKGRKTEMASVKEMYDKSDMLLQEAALADKFGDVEKADKLRKEAATLQKQIAAQKSTEKLQGSQADYYDAQAEYTRSTKPVVEQMKAQAVKDRANRPTGSGSGGGVKQWTPAQEGAWIKGTTKDILTQSGKDINNITPMEHAAAQQKAIAQLAALKKQQAQPGGLAAAAAAGTAGPAKQRIQFDTNGLPVQ